MFGRVVKMKKLKTSYGGRKLMEYRIIDLEVLECSKLYGLFVPNKIVFLVFTIFSSTNGSIWSPRIVAIARKMYENT